MKAPVIDLFHAEPTKFSILPRSEFDELCRIDAFREGPLVEENSRWFDRYGPYTPEKWAFGELKDGRLVRCNINEVK